MDVEVSQCYPEPVPDPEESARRADFEATALPHLDQLYSTATYLCRDPDRAADLVQDTMVRAFRFWHRFEPGTNCKSWLMTILYNAFRNTYRAAKRHGGGVAFDEAIHDRSSAGSLATGETASTDPARLVENRGLDDELEAALQSLRPEFLEVVVLIDLQEVSYEEAAEIIGRPIGTVRSRLARARRQLAEHLDAYGRQRGLVR